jgi:hypothetical protein
MRRMMFTAPTRKLGSDPGDCADVPPKVIISKVLGAMGCVDASWGARLRPRKRRRVCRDNWYAKGSLRREGEGEDEEIGMLATVAAPTAPTTSSPEMEVEATEEQKPYVKERTHFSRDSPAVDELTGDSLIAALSTVYTSVIALAGETTQVTRFHAVSAPGMSVSAYISRLFTYFKCSNACLLTSLVYIDRVLKFHPEFKVTDLSIHRLLATSMVLSAKFNDDLCYSNAYYAKVCGVTLQELNVLEATLLKLINWKANVTTEEHAEYNCRVVAAFQAVSHGAVSVD